MSESEESCLTVLSVTECRHLDAAEGWLALGLPREADEELAHLQPLALSHDRALAARWHNSGQWSRCVEIAAALVRQDPQCCDYWLWLARSVRRSSARGLQNAYAVLLRVQAVFVEPMIPFNLACYQAQMGNLEGARKWLAEAFHRASSIDPSAVERLRALADTDADLEPLRLRPTIASEVARPLEPIS